MASKSSALAAVSARQFVRRKRVEACKMEAPRGPLDMREVSVLENSTSAREDCGRRSR